MAISLGTFKRGEVPYDLTWTYRDFERTPIPVTGFSVIAKATDPLGVEYEATGAIVDGPAGKVGVPWDANMTDMAGPWTIVVWASDGTQVLASATISYNVAGQGAPTFP